MIKTSQIGKCLSTELAAFSLPLKGVFLTTGAKFEGTMMQL